VRLPLQALAAQGEWGTCGNTQQQARDSSSEQINWQRLTACRLQQLKVDGKPAATRNNGKH
jgi:hypothetical protein